ncbi:diphosphomevalonate decarboxylase [Linderina macrospora]|uniref:Diphosphomevalonate decarboxylase n=1 Tax=Linderina macrospora TaxID=4868 RepID=A0ACC1JDT7_9FUNG|nr:diphosphomevalonate decarboxylase [Linderina macrospora]
MAIYSATVTSPVNIAVIKYWGKRNPSLILPTNSSLSVTLSQDHLSTRTTIACSADFESDRLWLNGVEEDISASKRLVNSIGTARALRASEEAKNPELAPLSQYKIHVCSENNFPTAAGLASSASGYAALVSALGQLFELPQSTAELSRVARVGSGSACRSMFGGFVAWRMGEKEDGEDSMAEQVAERAHWPDLQALILVVSDKKKAVSSTAGMQTTVETSALFAERVRSVVPARMQAMEKAIKERDFAEFAKITMQDSNQFHAVCLDTYPPIAYMNDTSHAVTRIIHAYNAVKGYTAAAYTFDAGPNAVIYAPKSEMRDLVQLFSYLFPRDEDVLPEVFYTNPFGLVGAEEVGQTVSDPAVRKLAETVGKFQAGAVRRLIHTEVGDGPRVLDQAESLLSQSGMPKRARQ